MGNILPRLRRVQHSLFCKLPTIQPQEILEGYANVRVELPLITTHWETATLFDHTFIASLVQVLKPNRCLEIGTSLGLVTTTIAANSPESTEIHTLDLSDTERIGSFFRNRPEAKKIRQHFGSSQAFDFRPLHNTVDFIFIDGSHEFDDVRRDTENAFRLLSDRGVIVWHDVSSYFPGVVKALEASTKANAIFRVQGTSCGFYALPDVPVRMRTTLKGNLRNDVVAMDQVIR
jgi:predicted O-methyltransferase YrrM